MTAARRLMLCLGMVLFSAQAAMAAQGEILARPMGTHVRWLRRPRCLHVDAGLLALKPLPPPLSPGVCP